MVELKAKEGLLATVVEIILPPEGVITPDELKRLEVPAVNPRKGVILTGRAPIWLYAFLTHFYHPTKWIAIYDPRLGPVVVASHSPEQRVGEILKIEI